MKHIKHIYENFNANSELMQVENIFSTFGEDVCRVNIESGTIKIEIDVKKHPLFSNLPKKMVTLSNIENFNSSINIYQETSKSLNEFLSLLKRYLLRLKYHGYTWEISPITFGTNGLPNRIYIRVFLGEDPFSPIMKLIGDDKGGKIYEFDLGAWFLESSDYRAWNEPSKYDIENRKKVQDVFQNGFGIKSLSFHIDMDSTENLKYRLDKNQSAQKIKQWDRVISKSSPSYSTPALCVLLDKNTDKEKLENLKKCLDDMVDNKKIQFWRFEPSLTGNELDLQKEYHLKRFFSDDEIKNFLSQDPIIKKRMDTREKDNKDLIKAGSGADYDYPIAYYLDPGELHGTVREPKSLEEQVGLILIIHEKQW